MTTLTQSRMYRVSLAILAASLMAACSDKSSPTGATPLPQLNQTAAGWNHSDNFGAETNDTFTATEAGPINCSSFGETRARVFTRGYDVVVRYAVDDVPITGFYYVRFWPEGRHIGEPIDHAIGTIPQGQGASGEFVALSFEDLDRETTLNYQVGFVRR